MLVNCYCDGGLELPWLRFVDLRGNSPGMAMPFNTLTICIRNGTLGVTIDRENIRAIISRRTIRKDSVCSASVFEKGLTVE